MIDATILGGGSVAMACADVLSRAGFGLRRTLDIDPRDRSPIILGEVPTAYALARQAVEAGRHVLITAPTALTPDRLAVLLENRKRAQALFVWSERRYHPGYRFVSGLIEADATWRPRFLRHQTFSSEPPAGAYARWLNLEAVALVLSLAGAEPRSVTATSLLNPARNAPDLVSMTVSFDRLEAHLQVALGDPMERRETLLAAEDRKAFVDELNQSMPVRLIEEERGLTRGNAARWVTCTAPTEDELARQQCLAFLDATLKAQHASDEAQLWQQAISVAAAVDRSLARDLSERVTPVVEEPTFRVIAGQSMPHRLRLSR